MRGQIHICVPLCFYAYPSVIRGALTSVKVVLPCYLLQGQGSSVKKRQPIWECGTIKATVSLNIQGLLQHYGPVQTWCLWIARPSVFIWTIANKAKFYCTNAISTKYRKCVQREIWVPQRILKTKYFHNEDTSWMATDPYCLVFQGKTVLPYPTTATYVLTGSPCYNFHNWLHCCLSWKCHLPRDQEPFARWLLGWLANTKKHFSYIYIFCI